MCRSRYDLCSSLQKTVSFLLYKQSLRYWRVGMPKSCCSGCHRMFSSLSVFDLHRTGKFQRKIRRCLTEQEMRERGTVQHEKGWWMRSPFERALLGLYQKMHRRRYD